MCYSRDSMLMIIVGQGNIQVPPNTIIVISAKHMTGKI